MAEYIDREKMLKYLEKNNTADEWIVGQYNADWIYSFIESQPTADVVEVKHGEWIRNERNIPKMKEFHKKGIATAMKATSIFYTCSCCNDWGTPIQKYCSGCGAKMNNVVNYESTKTIKIERRSE